MVKARPRRSESSLATSPWAFVALVTASACGDLFGVGELTADADISPPANGGVAGAGASQPLAGSAPSAGKVGMGAGNAGGGGGSVEGDLGGAGGDAPASGANAGAGGLATALGGASGSAGSADMGEAGDDRGNGSDGEAGAGGSGPPPPSISPPSCRNLAAVCGTPTSVSRDCCASTDIAGGSYFRSFDGVPGAGWDQPSYPASVGAFRLDLYEVTVGRFRRFVEAYPWLPSATEGRNPANPDDAGWQDDWSAFMPADRATLDRSLQTCGATDGAASQSTWTVAPGTNEALPANCVTWFEAFAFCAWDGGRLPSEAEWNYAAAGGVQARVYPWSSTLLTDIDANHAVYEAPIAPVGSKPLGLGLFGNADLAGNVWEWNVDWYRDVYRVPCEDCAELTQDAGIERRVLRGGAYYNQPSFLRTAPRGNAPPTLRDSGYGFRCARDLEVHDP